ncbi:exotoxin beta-grasp domain-containing protein [Paenibacillus wynnii]|uniref:Uncharacterized protein n=1 Tax=Paenibacillus wynnii TaxID=268407 RepID=A0A098M2Z8_9BACL|nr:exotoxin beta-grasp domain-containing protein [Paenibacillus wynnii]KGE16351.1 hypothetical protein PWYN_16525 [Paenibacillus wynnii]
MSLILQSVDMERLECFSKAMQAYNDEANKVCKGLVTVCKKTETDYEWEITYYGKSVFISSDEILKILNQNNDTNYKEKFKELVAWKLRAV